MGCKPVEAARSINNVLGLGIANERTLQWWFKKFCKGDESLEDAECTGRPSEAANDQSTGSSKLIFLQLPKNLLKNSVSTILLLLSIWRKLERWKSLISGCLVSRVQIKEIITLKCHLLLFYTTTMNHLLSRFWCATQSGFYMTTGNDRLSGCT